MRNRFLQMLTFALALPVIGCIRAQPAADPDIVEVDAEVDAEVEVDASIEILDQEVPDPRLRYSTALEAFAALPRAAVLGEYTREPVENTWHVGRIIDDRGLRWLNTAGVRWSLGDAVASGRLTGGSDNNYANEYPDIDFHLQLVQDADGAYQPQVLGFIFLGELYRRTAP